MSHPQCCIGRNEQVNGLKKPDNLFNVKNLFNKSLKSSVSLPAAEFVMGSDHNSVISGDRETPARSVHVFDFSIDSTPVTNKQFSRFIRATRYITDAESIGWSFVFHSFITQRAQKMVISSVGGAGWWLAVEKATWRSPEGLDSNIDNRMNHPVVHVSWNDALAYCEWKKNRLPTEVEWEYAARGGLNQKQFPWGDKLTSDGTHFANVWQGDFPTNNSAEDVYIGTSPVRTYSSNNFGLFDMVGNVWEWCIDPWFDDPGKVNYNSNMTLENSTRKVIRGGSYLCHESYCTRYRVSARTFNTADSSSGNLGFRCAGQ